MVEKPRSPRELAEDMAEDIQKIQPVVENSLDEVLVVDRSIDQGVPDPFGIIPKGPSAFKKMKSVEDVGVSSNGHVPTNGEEKMDLDKLRERRLDMLRVLRTEFFADHEVHRVKVGSPIEA